MRAMTVTTKIPEKHPFCINIFFIFEGLMEYTPKRTTAANTENPLQEIF